MKTTILIIGIIGLCAGCYFLDEAKKEALFAVEELSVENSDLKRELRALQNENKKLNSQIAKFDEKKEEKIANSPITANPVVEEKQEQPQQIPRPIVREERIEEPKKDNTQIIQKISQINEQIRQTQEKMKIQERDWIIESSQRGIRTSEIEKNELRAKVNSYIQQLESQKRELEKSL